jgi:hypothetical protein
MGYERSIWMERKRFIHVQKCSSPLVSSTANKKGNTYDFKWLHRRESISTAGISFANLIVRTKNQRGGDHEPVDLLLQKSPGKEAN